LIVEHAAKCLDRVRAHGADQPTIMVDQERIGVAE
jgi:hypothetical protein